VTKHYRPFKAGQGYLLRLDSPSSVTWYTQGRLATRMDVIAAISVGLPTLLNVCQNDDETMECHKMAQVVLDHYLPKN
jgi:hypothetical protein